MKKTVITLTLLAGISLNLFAQREIPMFFDKELGLATTDDYYQFVAYSSDGSKVAIVNKRKITIWDSTSGKEIARFTHDKYISGLVFSHNGRQLASFDKSSIKIWDIASGALTRNIQQSDVTAIAINRDSSRISSAYSGKDVGRGLKIWNIANGSELHNLVGITKRINFITYSPDGKQILTASFDGIIIRDAGNGQVIKTINGNFYSAIYNPNGQQIAAYDSDGNMRIYNTESGQELRYVKASSMDNILSYSPDGKSLLINTYTIIDSNFNTNWFIKIFDSDTGRELRSFNNDDRAIAFSPDGRKILTASGTFKFKIGDTTYGASYASILDATTGRTIGTIGYGPLNVGAKAFADLQIARFLNNTAEVSKNEAVLKFITDKGYATRQEIEAFYRDNVRALIAGVVDEEFKGKKIPTTTISHIKQTLINFYQATDQVTKLVNYNNLIAIDIGLNDFPSLYDIYRFSYNLLNYAKENNWDTTKHLRSVRDTEAKVVPYIEALKTPSLSNMVEQDISWDNAYEAYNNILGSICTESLYRDIKSRNIRR